MNTDQLRADLAEAEQALRNANCLASRRYWTERQRDAANELEIARIVEALGNSPTPVQLRELAGELARRANNRSAGQVARMEARMGIATSA